LAKTILHELRIKNLNVARILYNVPFVNRSVEFARLPSIDIVRLVSNILYQILFLKLVFRIFVVVTPVLTVSAGVRRLMRGFWCLLVIVVC